MAKSREDWLSAAIKQLRPVFKSAGEELPEKVYVSVGWPGGRGNKRNTIGQCWAASAVADGVPAVFISPVVDSAEKALEVLTHELVHAVGKNGHRKDFSDLAAKVGLVKPWTATSASEPLKETLKKIADKLGPYNHGRIAPTSLIRQATRLLKVVCPIDGYTIRVTQKWIDFGLPTCPCGMEMEQA